jgi:hypothetical protein
VDSKTMRVLIGGFDEEEMGDSPSGSTGRDASKKGDTNFKENDDEKFQNALGKALGYLSDSGISSSSSSSGSRRAGTSVGQSGPSGSAGTSVGQTETQQRHMTTAEFDGVHEPITSVKVLSSWEGALGRGLGPSSTASDESASEDSANNESGDAVDDNISNGNSNVAAEKDRSYANSDDIGRKLSDATLTGGLHWFLQSGRVVLRKVVERKVARSIPIGGVADEGTQNTSLPGTGVVDVTNVKLSLSHIAHGCFEQARNNRKFLKEVFCTNAKSDSHLTSHLTIPCTFRGSFSSFTTNETGVCIPCTNRVTIDGATGECFLDINQEWYRQLGVGGGTDYNHRGQDTTIVSKTCVRAGGDLSRSTNFFEQKKSAKNSKSKFNSDGQTRYRLRVKVWDEVEKLANLTNGDGQFKTSELQLTTDGQRLINFSKRLVCDEWMWTTSAAAGPTLNSHVNSLPRGLPKFTIVEASDPEFRGQRMQKLGKNNPLSPRPMATVSLEFWLENGANSKHSGVQVGAGGAFGAQNGALLNGNLSGGATSSVNNNSSYLRGTSRLRRRAESPDEENGEELMSARNRKRKQETCEDASEDLPSPRKSIIKSGGSPEKIKMGSGSAVENFSKAKKKVRIVAADGISDSDAEVDSDGMEDIMMEDATSVVNGGKKANTYTNSPKTVQSDGDFLNGAFQQAETHVAEITTHPVDHVVPTSSVIHPVAGNRGKGSSPAATYSTPSSISPAASLPTILRNNHCFSFANLVKLYRWMERSNQGYSREKRVFHRNIGRDGWTSFLLDVIGFFYQEANNRSGGLGGSTAAVTLDDMDFTHVHKLMKNYHAGFGTTSGNPYFRNSLNSTSSSTFLNSSTTFQTFQSTFQPTFQPNFQEKQSYFPQKILYINNQSPLALLAAERARDEISVNSTQRLGLDDQVDEFLDFLDLAWTVPGVKLRGGICGRYRYEREKHGNRGSRATTTGSTNGMGRVRSVLTAGNISGANHNVANGPITNTDSASLLENNSSSGSIQSPNLGFKTPVKKVGSQNTACFTQFKAQGTSYGVVNNGLVQTHVLRDLDIDLMDLE